MIKPRVLILLIIVCVFIFGAVIPESASAIGNSDTLFF